jgi:uncharacterized protein
VPTDPVELAVLCALVLAGAMLYSSGGHAGASAYLAAMALFGVSAAVMKPTALVMNIIVATVGTARFSRAKLVPWAFLRPLCLGSIPAAFVGGSIQLPPRVYLPFLGAMLLLAAVRLWLPAASGEKRTPPAFGWFVAFGVVMGFVSGLTGIGGGIFLSPLLLLTGWEEPRRTAGAAAVFILVNSVLGFLGHVSAAQLIPPQAALLGVVALAGGLVGSWVGVNRLSPNTLRRVHALVLVVAGGKLLFER